MSESFQHFLNSAGKFPLLTKDQELMLGKQVQAWLEIKDVTNPTPDQKRIIRMGERAYRKFFQSNIRLVVSIAKKYAHLCKFHSLDDLIQEGSFGLSRAVQKFDPTRGYKFSTYAYWWIRQSITRAMSQTESHIRLPVTCVECLNKVRKFIPDYVSEHGSFPDVAAMAEHADVSVEAMKGYLPYILGIRSLDERVSNAHDNGSHLVELIESDVMDPFEQMEYDDAWEVVSRLLPKLSGRQLHTINHRFGLLNGGKTKTLRETGVTMGVSQETTRKYEKNALATMKVAAIVSRDLIAS